MIRNENYLVIQGWMINELKLKGNELLLYAIIHGFSQDNQKFSGSLQYLAGWCNSTKRGVMKALDKLIEKKMYKKEGGVRWMKKKIKTLGQYHKVIEDKIENDKALKGVCVFIVDPQGNNIGYIMVNEKLEVMDRLEKGYKVNGE